MKAVKQSTVPDGRPILKSYTKVIVSSSKKKKDLCIKKKKANVFDFVCKNSASHEVPVPKTGQTLMYQKYLTDIEKEIFL